MNNDTLEELVEEVISKYGNPAKIEGYLRVEFQDTLRTALTKYGNARAREVWNEVRLMLNGQLSHDQAGYEHFTVEDTEKIYKRVNEALTKKDK